MFRQRLYMVKVDIKKAFDSINQENLLHLIYETLKEVSNYTDHRIFVDERPPSEVFTLFTTLPSYASLLLLGVFIGQVHYTSALEGEPCERANDETVQRQRYRPRRHPPLPRLCS